MKKTLLIVTLVVLALGALGVGVALAQGQNPPFAGNGPADGMGYLHSYMAQAMADVVNLPVDQFEARHDAGETFYQIALSQGFTAEEIPTLMQDARTAALKAAIADGVITQEQADWMGSHGYGRGGMMGGYGYGNGNGDCPMFDGDVAPNGSFGQGFGRGMMGGGRWQTQNQ